VADQLDLLVISLEAAVKGMEAVAKALQEHEDRLKRIERRLDGFTVNPWNGAVHGSCNQEHRYMTAQGIVPDYMRGR
jgi:hypothetical protein